MIGFLALGALFLGGLLVGLASVWLMPKPENKTSITIEKTGSDNPIPVIYGTRRVGAIKVHKYVTDTPNEADNDLLHLICVFAEGEVDQIGELFFNGLSENDDKFSGGSLNGKWYQAYRYTGADGQPASAAAVSGIPNWTTDHRLDGLAYVYLVLQMPFEENKDRVWRGEPEVTAIIRGNKVLDTRTGLTEYSENPAMCLRDYLTNSRYGKGLPTSFIDVQSFETVANVCDQTTSNTVTTTEYTLQPRPEDGRLRPSSTTTTKTVEIPRFSLNLDIDTAQDYMSNVSEILSSFRGIVQDMTGSAKITLETTLQEQYGVSETAFRFTADDMIDGIDHDGGSIDERFNVVEVRFPNKKKNYEKDSVFFPDDNDPLRAQWIAEDGGKDQPESIEVDSITTKAEALQLAEVVAKRSRFTKVAKITGMPWTIQVEVGDVVGLDSQMNGWTDKPFRVMEKTLNEDDTVDFVLREHNDSVYPWSGRAFDETIGGTWLGDPTDLSAPSGLTLTQDPTLSRTGTLEWSSTQNAFVRRYQVRILNSSSEVVFDVDVLGNAWDVPLLDAGDYTAEVYAVSTVGARSPASALAFTLAAPVAPTSLSVTARDWELEVAPQLAGIGLGTVFEFDIVAGDGTGYTPASKGRATTFTFTGLLPDTLYTVYARSVNAYGESAWVSAQATTTNTGEQVGDLIQVEVEPIQERLDLLNGNLGGIDEVLEQVAQDMQEIYQRSNVEERVRQEEQVRAAAIAEVNTDLTTLNNTTLPTLQSELDAAEQDLLALEGKFPITGTDISDSAISTPKLAANSVISSKIVAGAVTTDKMTANSINGDRIAARTLAADKIIANSLTAAEIAAGAITATEIASNTITAAQIAALTITANEIASNTITADQIAANTIGADEIAANSITANEIAALTITADELAANSITATKINAGAVEADKLSADAIDGKTITGAVVQTSSGTGSRTILADDGTYHIWAGSGAKTDANGTFWIKKDGTGFISGQFFQGEIIETRYGSNSGSEPLTATAVGHNSAGNTVEITGVAQGTDSETGNFAGQSRTLTVTIKRDTTTLATKTSTAVGVYDSGFNVTRWAYSYNISQLDNGTSSGVTYDYSITGEVSTGVALLEIDFKTFENKLG